MAHDEMIRRLTIEVKQLRRAPTDSTRCRSIQEQLLKSISSLERRFRRTSVRLRETRISRNRAGLSPEARTAIKRRIQHQLDGLEECKHLMFVYRLIGDAIAYIYLDRYDIKPMAMKTPPGLMTGKSGLRLELRIFRKLFDAGHLAILNDLTNCLRYGDITALRADGQATLFEVKSGKSRHPREERQLQRLNEILEYVENDTPMQLYEHTYGKSQRRELHRPAVHRLICINRLLRKARHSRSAHAEAESGLVYIVFAYDENTEVANILDAANGGDQPIALLLSQHRGAWPSYFPLAFSLTRPDDFIDVAFGKIAILVVWDFEHVRRYFSERSIIAELEPHDSDWVFNLRSEPQGAPTFKIGAHFVARLVSEFASLDWMLSEIHQRFNAVLPQDIPD